MSLQQQQQQQTPSSIAEALSLDVQVLTLLLRRNCSSQHRSRYYRRLKMMTKCLSRHRLDDGTFFGYLLSSIRSEVDWIESMSDRDRRKRARGGVEDRWTTKKSSVDPSNTTQNIADDEDDSSSLSSKVVLLSQTLTSHLPEALSRILYAAEAFYVELSRGYFVPFCTVSVSSISRIRALLMRMGREGCIELGRCLSAFDEVLKAEHIMGHAWHGRLNLTRLKKAMDTIRRDNTLQEDIDWGDWTRELMDEFVEVDATEHDKDQRARQREGALRRGMSDISSTSAGLARSEAEINEDDNDDDADRPVQLGEKFRADDNNDIGESVDIGGGNTEAEATKESTKRKKRAKQLPVDVNEQILHLMKGKKRRKTSSKVEKSASSTSKPQIQMEKESIDIFGNVMDVSEEEPIREDRDIAKDSKKKKDKSKKEKNKKSKKKSKKNAVDDIFAGL